MEADKVVKCPGDLKNGLEFKALTMKPKTNVRDLLEIILVKARIPRLSDEELKQRLQARGILQ
jgi:hypothetical protein